jgi:hypothetical protein
VELMALPLSPTPRLRHKGRPFQLRLSVFVVSLSQ